MNKKTLNKLLEYKNFLDEHPLINEYDFDNRKMTFEIQAKNNSNSPRYFDESDVRNELEKKGLDPVEVDLYLEEHNVDDISNFINEQEQYYVKECVKDKVHENSPKFIKETGINGQHYYLQNFLSQDPENPPIYKEVKTERQFERAIKQAEIMFNVKKYELVDVNYVNNEDDTIGIEYSSMQLDKDFLNDLEEIIGKWDGLTKNKKEELLDDYSYDVDMDISIKDIEEEIKDIKVILRDVQFSYNVATLERVVEDILENNHFEKRKILTKDNFVDLITNEETFNSYKKDIEKLNLSGQELLTLNDLCIEKQEQRVIPREDIFIMLLKENNTDLIKNFVNINYGISEQIFLAFRLQKQSFPIQTLKDNSYLQNKDFLLDIREKSVIPNLTHYIPEKFFNLNKQVNTFEEFKKTIDSQISKSYTSNDTNFQLYKEKYLPGLDMKSITKTKEGEEELINYLKELSNSRTKKDSKYSNLPERPEEMLKMLDEYSKNITKYSFFAYVINKIYVDFFNGDENYLKNESQDISVDIPNRRNLLELIFSVIDTLSQQEIDMSVKIAYIDDKSGIMMYGAEGLDKCSDFQLNKIITVGKHFTHGNIYGSQSDIENKLIPMLNNKNISIETLNNLKEQILEGSAKNYAPIDRGIIPSIIEKSIELIENKKEEVLKLNNNLKI